MQNKMSVYFCECSWWLLIKCGVHPWLQLNIYPNSGHQTLAGFKSLLHTHNYLFFFTESKTRSQPLQLTRENWPWKSQRSWQRCGSWDLWGPVQAALGHTCIKNQHWTYLQRNTTLDIPAQKHNIGHTCTEPHWTYLHRNTTLDILAQKHIGHTCTGTQHWTYLHRNTLVIPAQTQHWSYLHRYTLDISAQKHWSYLHRNTLDIHTQKHFGHTYIETHWTYLTETHSLQTCVMFRLGIKGTSLSMQVKNLMMLPECMLETHP